MLDSLATNFAGEDLDGVHVLRMLVRSEHDHEKRRMNIAWLKWKDLQY